MNGRFPNTILYKFPRMSPQDSEIWRRFLLEQQNNFERFDYDFPVGSGVDPGPEISANYRKDYIDLTKKRIDAVGYNKSQVTIFEVKPRAGTTALGQLLTYQELWMLDHKGSSVPTLSVVTEFMNPEEISIYTHHRIKIFIV